MSNKHVNGDDPYRMTVSEAAKEIDGWVNNGGQIRVDAPHQGNNEVHAHLYLDNDPNTDLLIQIEPDPDDDIQAVSSRLLTGFSRLLAGDRRAPGAW